MGRRRALRRGGARHRHGRNAHDARTGLSDTIVGGLLRREKSGVLGIGFESFLALLLYVGAFALLFLTG